MSPYSTAAIKICQHTWGHSKSYLIKIFIW